LKSELAHQKRKRAEAVIEKWRKGTVSHAFEAWKKIVLVSKRQRLLNELAEAKRARATDLTKFIRRETLIPCFFKWRKYVRNNRQWKAKRQSLNDNNDQRDLDTSLRQHWTEDEILDVYWKYLGVRYTRFQ